MQNKPTAFENAGKEKRATLLGEFAHFLRTNKKWWLLPILVMIGLMALLSFFAGTGAAPFIYTIF